MNSQPISLIRGHDSVAPVHIEIGYAPLDLSTATAATFTAKPGDLSTVVKITKTLGSGVTAGLLGLANISFSVADMAELDVSNSYTWSLTATVGGVASIVARGVLTAIGEPQQFVDEGVDQGVDQEARDLAASKASPEQVAASTAAHNADVTAHSLLVSMAPRLRKSNPMATLFAASGQTVVTAQECYARVGGVIIRIPGSTAVALPTLTAGTDYAIYLLANGTLLASANSSAPDGYTTATSTQLGGAHYAPGGNAAAEAGGDSTPQFNPYSAWDLNFRPRCADPRGMAFVVDGWFDIYIANTTPDLLGTSAYNAPIADGATLPKLPAFWGGNGTTTMSSFSYWSAVQYFAAFGKHLPRYSHLMNACYGVTENTSVGTEPTVTALDNLRTSRFGLMQATGSMWCWIDEHKDKIHQAELASGATTAQIEAWINAAKMYSGKSLTESHGLVRTYGDVGHSVGLHGGDWGGSSNAGSRATSWSFSPANSGSFAGARGRSDHLILP